MNDDKANKYKVISLFTGCGGSDLGMIGGFNYLGKKYQSLKFDIVHASDIDKFAQETYNHNFDHNLDLIDINNLPDSDIVVGGFPCQSFSTVNPNKNPFDERGQLYKKMAEILRIKKPKAFIAENVKGMMTLKKGTIFKSILKEFSKSGYNINYKLINATSFGVPQKRERVFIVGIRKDLEIDFEFPEETHDLTTTNKLGAVIDSLEPEDEKYYFSKRAVEGMKKAKNNMKRGLYQSLDEPCLTITSHLAKVSLNSRDPVLLVNPEKELYRRFSPREAARIQSFPDNFEFPVSEHQAYRQIGNAIAPVVMWHVSKKLHKILQN